MILPFDFRPFWGALAILSAITSSTEMIGMFKIPTDELDITGIIIAITGVLTVLVSLSAVLNTNRAAAFSELKEANNSLKELREEDRKEIEKIKEKLFSLEKQVDREHRRNLRLEDYNHLLIRVLNNSGIPVPPFEDVDDSETHMTRE